MQVSLDRVPFMNSHPVIDYDSAVSVYMDNLTTMLRGFTPAEDNAFLETWVPDEDPARGVLGIFEAAYAGAVPAVTVRLGAETAAALDSEALRRDAAQFGRLELRTEGHTIVATLFCNTGGSFEEINPVYREALETAAQHRTFSGSLEPHEGMPLVTASDGPTTLTLLVDTGSHTVTKARYSGTPAEAERGLLEKFCSILEGKPILECSDHGVVELEHQLRDHSQPSPVSGVVTPESSDPIFALPSRLIRGALAEYRRQTGYAADENFYRRPASARWHNRSRVEKLRQIADAIERFPGGSNLHLIDLQDDHRVIIEIPQLADHRENQLLKLEHYLRHTVEPILEIHLEPKVDLNTIRKLKGGVPA